MGWISSILFDLVLISGGVAGFRRFTGVSLAAMIEPKIAHNNNLVLASRGYFGMGEWIVNKGMQFIENTRAPKFKNKE